MLEIVLLGFNYKKADFKIKVTQIGDDQLLTNSVIGDLHQSVKTTLHGVTIITEQTYFRDAHLLLHISTSSLPLQNGLILITIMAI